LCHVQRAAHILLVALAACSADLGEIDPRVGPASGYYAITLAEPDVGPRGVREVRVGDIAAYDIEVVDDDSFRVTVQGHPTPGEVDVVIAGAYGKTPFEVRVSKGFAYQPPADARFARMVALGASLTQGVQNGVPTHDGGRMSPAAQIARALGGYFPLPLLVRDFFPEMMPADIGPPPACAPPDVVAFVTKSAVEVLPKIAGSFAGARIDPDIEVHNLAVGGSKIHDVVAGPAEDDFPGNFVAHLVFDPHGTGPVGTSQLALAEALSPTIVVMADVFYNDVAASLLAGAIIDPSLITPLADYAADLAILLDRLDATGAEVFVSNMPRPSILPLTKEKRAVMIAEGSSAAEADAAIAATDDLAEQYNAILADEAAARPRVHVVDVASRIAELDQTGVEAGGQLLTVQKFGGLLSLDGVHFTDTGYAMFANAFVDTINSAFGTNVAPIDLDRVVATDRGSPAAIAAAGLDVSACTR
jgi:lysophospholipase L1-like esterase